MMIDSLLDTDLYKFTMMQAVLHQFPGAIVEYRFKCRNANINLVPYISDIQSEIKSLCSLAFKEDELAYLSEFPFFKKDYIDFLRIFRLSEEFITVVEEEGELDIIVKGPWLHTIMFEVPVLAIIGEIYYQNNYSDFDLTVGREKLKEKIAFVQSQKDVKGFKFSEFGTRRRFSRAWQGEVIQALKDGLPDNLTGTSNVFFAKAYGIKPIGTMAHEYLQACQSLGPRLVYSQQFAFERWAQEYRGELGIALSDVFGLKAFLHDFDMYFCKLFDGARQDSGDPFEWGDALIAHYEEMRVDPKIKTLVFTDQLTLKKAFEIYLYFKDRTNPAFGIGTQLTCDLGFEALQNVIKMVECNGQPVAKISDTPGKTMCRDTSYLNYLKQVFQID